MTTATKKMMSLFSMWCFLRTRKSLFNSRCVFSVIFFDSKMNYCHCHSTLNHWASTNRMKMKSAEKVVVRLLCYVMGTVDRHQHSHQLIFARAETPNRRWSKLTLSKEKWKRTLASCSTALTVLFCFRWSRVKGQSSDEEMEEKQTRKVKWKYANFCYNSSNWVVISSFSLSVWNVRVENRGSKKMDN